MNNNIIKLKGKLNFENVKTFESHNYTFIDCKIEVARTSGVIDCLPLTISAKLGKVESEQFIEICGELRTRNEIADGKSKLIIFVFAKELKLLDCEEYQNEVELQGFLCKQSIVRQTPLTERKIADVLIAVNGRNNRTAYIPTICWNRDCDFISQQPIGTELKVKGRLQSRNYEKLLESGEKEIRTAIELCTKNIKKVIPFGISNAYGSFKIEDKDSIFTEHKNKIEKGE